MLPQVKQAGLTQKSTSWPAGFSINNINNLSLHDYSNNITIFVSLKREMTIT